MKFTFYITFFFLFPCLSFSQLYQPVKDSVYTKNFLQTDFYNDINSARFNSFLNFETKLNKFKFLVKNNYNSDVTKLGDYFPRDYNNLKFITTYAFTEKLSAGAGIMNRILSDNKNVELNKGANNYLFGNLDYSPSNAFLLNTKIGYRTDNQIGEYNSGFSGSFDAETRNLNIYDFLATGKLSLSNDFLSEKTNYFYELNTSVSKSFSDFADNTGYLTAYTYRSDFYTPATQSISETYNVKNNIQSRYEKYATVSDVLNYNFTKNLKVQLSVFFSVKNVKNEYRYKPAATSIIIENIYDYEYNETYLQAIIKTDLSFSGFYFRGIAIHTERDEVHKPTNTEMIPPQQLRDLENREKDKNNSSKNTMLLLETEYPFSNTNKIIMLGSASLLRYDTDSKTNYDDRDEAAFNLSLSHIYTNKSNFELATIFEYNTNTLNFIFKEKSSNNNTNKIYKLSSVSSYIPFKGLITRNLFQVLANYTVYKYEDIVTQVQSFSFRQLYITDSTVYNLTKRLSVDFRGSLRLYEQGQFNNNNFAVKPLAYYDERNADIGINYGLTNYLMFTAGFKHFIQRQYIYDKGVKNLKRTYAVYGPLLKAEFRFSRASRIFISGGLDYIESSDNSLTSLSKNLIIKVLWNI